MKNLILCLVILVTGCAPSVSSKVAKVNLDYQLSCEYMKHLIGRDGQRGCEETREMVLSDGEKVSCVQQLKELNITAQCITTVINCSQIDTVCR